MLVALGVVIVTGVLLHFTVFGRYTYAVGSNAESARRVGINVDRHLLKVYALAGSLSGFGGVLSLARFNTTSIGGHTSPIRWRRSPPPRSAERACSAGSARSSGR